MLVAVVLATSANQGVAVLSQQSTLLDYQLVDIPHEAQIDARGHLGPWLLFYLPSHLADGQTALAKLGFQSLE